MNLSTEIQSLDAALVASRDYAAIASAVTAARPPIIGKVERAEFATWAAISGMRSKIEDAANDPASPLRDAALGIKDVLVGAAASIDFGIADNRNMLDAWVAFGQCSEINKNKLLLLATREAEIATAEQVEVSMKNEDGSYK